jgi:hypothetical protein
MPMQKPEGLHTGYNHWNAQWREFFRMNPRASRDQILDQLNKDAANDNDRERTASLFDAQMPVIPIQPRPTAELRLRPPPRAP